MPETPTPQYSFASYLSYEQCIAALAQITERLEVLVAKEEVTIAEYNARLATINNLDTILLIHGINRNDDDDDEGGA